MTISTRTPEGYPSRCPLCGADTNIEFSDPAGDAPCPRCGQLLWLSRDLLTSLQDRLAELSGAPPDQITPDTTFAELRTGSIEMVELLMQLEDEFDLTGSGADTAEIRTVGDMIRFVQGHRGGSAEA